MTTTLYNTEILRLAASLAGQSRLADPQVSVEKRSPTCGSRVTVDLVVEDDQVVAFGQEVRACALGQAGAALLGQNVIGADATAITTAAADLRAYLSGTRDDPGVWPGLEIFAPARSHRARHASILLAFDATAEAISSRRAAP
jgi:NifU-like protein involved in Fe-S cluster formation